MIDAQDQQSVATVTRGNRYEHPTYETTQSAWCVVSQQQTLITS